MSDWVRTRLPSKKSRRSSKQSLKAGCSFAMPSTSFLLKSFFAMVSRPGDEPAWSLCPREICGSGRTSRTSFVGQKVEAILHRDPLRLREKRVLASCLNAKEGNMPWQRLPDSHRYCGSQSPVCYCYTKPPCAGFPRRARKIMNTKAKRIVVPVFPGCQLYLWGAPVFPGCQLFYTCPLPNALKHHKGEEPGLLLHVQHSFRFDYDTRYSPSRHH